ncbi:MAG: FKBP-type peptidyl-prolyl cis-trans isomerase [Prevotellaceae bacterium]|jgi:FKBP-type peptidyl-prolyl cis-trans isomerase|nr:FKBP-type peptidyl-prolyl cis-trans isomerase [Prevotellaceae bacterium]
MRNRLFRLFVLFVLCGLASCEKEDPVEKQAEKIEAYIKAKMNKNPTLKLSLQNGVYYLYEPGDTTISATAGDSVYFYYAGTLVTDTLKYFDTNYRELARALKLNIEFRQFEPVGVIVGNNNLLPGLSIGLNMTHLYDSGEIIFNSDMGFGEKSNGIVPPLSALIFKISIYRISKK